VKSNHGTFHVVMMRIILYCIYIYYGTFTCIHTTPLTIQVLEVIFAESLDEGICIS
jgi:hypothetical protein